MSPVTPPPADEILSLHEMLQIMDVARAIREEQLTVEQQFNIEETRARIRDRLIASAQVAGDNVTPAEVDTAIQLYFDTLNVYRDPPWGVKRLLAQMYVWRVKVVSLVAVIGTLGVGLWLAFFNPAMPWSAQRRATQAIQKAEEDARTVVNQLRAITPQDAEAAAAITQLTQEFQAIEATGNFAAIQQSKQRMADLLATLNEQYDLQIVTGAGRDSAVTRNWVKGGPGALSYYVIVEARSRDGHILSQTIQNTESGHAKSVTSWGEQVSKEVYDRLKADKLADGVLNETHFGEKKRGALLEQVSLPGPDGQPLKRGMQITHWD